MSVASEIRGLVEAAIRRLGQDNALWAPIHGGEWTAMNGAVVIINKATRFCVKPSYRVIHPEFGVFNGYLNGVTGRNVGKAAQVMTKSQMEAERSYDAPKAIAEALSQ